MLVLQHPDYSLNGGEAYRVVPRYVVFVVRHRLVARATRVSCFRRHSTRFIYYAHFIKFARHANNARYVFGRGCLYAYSRVLSVDPVLPLALFFLPSFQSTDDQTARTLS